jgi:hypothetical protein
MFLSRETNIIRKMGIIGDPEKQGNIEKLVKNMRIGEKGYIYAWGVSFDGDINPYLNLRAKVTKRKEGDSDKIPIVRFGPGETDYKIDIRKSRYGWELEEEPFSDYDWNEKEVVRLPYDSCPNKKIKGAPRKEHRKSLKDRLGDELNRAVITEEFELAAQLRDRIKKLANNTSS